MHRMDAKDSVYTASSKNILRQQTAAGVVVPNTFVEENAFRKPLFSGDLRHTLILQKSCHEPYLKLFLVITA